MKTIIEKSDKSKSGILKKIGEWGWASIIANLLTLSTLWYTMYDNKKKETQEKAKESDENIELNRIRRRDSVQIALLTQSYNSQNADMQLGRKNDSTQLKQYNYQLGLLNESLKAQIKALNIQNESLVIQKTTSQASLSANIYFESIRVPFGSYSSYLGPQPMIQVKNSGGTMAYDIEIKVLNFVVDNWEKKVIACSPIYFGDTYNLTIESNRTDDLKNVPQLYLRTDYDSEKIKYRTNLLEKSGQELGRELQKLRDKKDENTRPKEIELSNNYYTYQSELFRKYSHDVYRNYLITQIKYRDKYDQKKKVYYSVDQVIDVWPTYRSRPNSTNPTHMDIQVKCIRANVDDILIAKECLTKFNFDYESILSKVSDYN